MPKTKAQIQADYPFQNPGQTLDDIVEYFDDDGLRAHLQFSNEFRLYEALVAHIDNDALTADFPFLFEGDFMLRVIDQLDGGGGPSASVPDAISDLSVSSYDDDSVTLSFTAPANNGAAITDYVVQYREGTSGAWTTFADGVGTSTSIQVTGLTELTTYQFQVAATNSEGTGAYSNVVTQRTDAPFTNNANTYFYNFLSSENRTVTSNDEVLVEAIEQLRNENSLVQQTLDYAPLIVTGEGINCNQNTARQMTFNFIDSIANGTDGWYMAFNAKVTTGNSHILNIARAVITTPSRGQAYFTGSRNWGVKADENDGGSINWLGYSPQITFDTWYTFEARLIADGATANPLTLWIDGVEQTLTAQDANTFAQFAATAPSEVLLFNDSGDDDSFDGVIQDFIFQNENPSAAIRSSISTNRIAARPSN